MVEPAGLHAIAAGEPLEERLIPAPALFRLASGDEARASEGGDVIADRLVAVREEGLDRGLLRVVTEDPAARLDRG